VCRGVENAWILKTKPHVGAHQPTTATKRQRKSTMKKGASKKGGTKTGTPRNGGEKNEGIENRQKSHYRPQSPYRCLQKTKESLETKRVSENARKGDGGTEHLFHTRKKSPLSKSEEGTEGRVNAGKKQLRNTVEKQTKEDERKKRANRVCHKAN